MGREIVRQLIGGVWRTSDVPGGGGGGPQPVAVTLNGTVKDYDPPGGIDNAETIIFATAPQRWQPNHFYSIGASVVTPDGLLTPRVDVIMRGVSGDAEPVWSTDGSLVDDDGTLSWQANPYAGGWAADSPFESRVWIGAAGSAWLAEGAGASGGSEPDWASAPNPSDEVVDNEITWLNQGTLGTWQPNHSYQIQPVPTSVLPTAPGEWVFNLYQVNVIGGTSGSVEPTWPAQGQELIDGELQWDCDIFPAAIEITGIKAPTTFPRTLTVITVQDGPGGSGGNSQIDDAAQPPSPSSLVSEAANQINCGGSSFSPNGSNLVAGNTFLVYMSEGDGWARVNIGT